MSLRSLCARVLRTPRTATSQSWPTHARLRIPYGDARHRANNYGTQQLSSKAYSNFAPRGSSQYYGAYGQPPKPRASRLKDMAIGSTLTIITYLAYCFYESRQVLNEMMAGFHDRVFIPLPDICLHYDKLLREAEAEDDGSPESAEKIRRIAHERAVAIMYRGDPKEVPPTTDMGPLPRFPEGHKKYGSEVVRDLDSAVFLSPPGSKEEEEVAMMSPAEKPYTIGRIVLVAVNESIKDVGINHPRPSGQPLLKLNEIEDRLTIMMDNLLQAGALDPDRPALIVLLLRDGYQHYLHEPRHITRLSVDDIKSMTNPQ